MGNDTSAPKKLFEQLDKTKDGVLTLDDLLNGNFAQSPLLLFRFDDGEDGALDREEFEKWVRHMQAHKKKHKKKRRTEKKNQDKERKNKDKDKKKKRRKDKDNNKPEEDEDFSRAWTTLDENAASKLKLSRNSETPCIIGQGSPQLSHLESQLGGLSRRSDELQVLLSEEAKAFLINLLRRSEGRKRYMDWLFRLADVDKDGDIEVEELNLILKALEKDGIRISDLSYEKCIDPTKVGQRLLEEYATNKSGTLTREEFMVLADLIMRHYEEGYARTRKRRIGRYELKRKLGSGANSIVRLAINTETGEKKAIKVIKRGDVSDMSRVDVELKAMMMLDHPSIVKLNEVLENEEYVFFVMELCGGGSLSNYVEMKPLSERLARYYMPQLIKGLKYCHNKGVCHRDLKLENLLIDNNGHLKISDFGHAGIYKEGWDLFNTRLVGSLYHLSPEQVQGQCYSGEKIDIWALGVILYRLLAGKPPFFSRNPQEFLSCVAQARFEMPERLSADAKDLIDMILQPDPANRPSCSKILKHPWFDGPIKEPALARYVLQLDSRFEDYTMPWNRIREIVAGLNIHLFPAAPTKRHHLLMYKCVYTKKELKFSITLKKRKYSKGNPYIEFNLHEGEGWEFNEAVYKIRATFRRWKKSVFPPGSARNESSDSSSSSSSSDTDDTSSSSSDSDSDSSSSSSSSSTSDERHKRRGSRKHTTGTSASSSSASSSNTEEEDEDEEEGESRQPSREGPSPTAAAAGGGGGGTECASPAARPPRRTNVGSGSSSSKTANPDAHERPKRPRDRQNPAIAAAAAAKERKASKECEADSSAADRSRSKGNGARRSGGSEDEREDDGEVGFFKKPPKRGGLRDQPAVEGDRVAEVSAGRATPDHQNAGEADTIVAQARKRSTGEDQGQQQHSRVESPVVGLAAAGAAMQKRSSKPPAHDYHETTGPQKAKPSAHARAAEDEAHAEPGDGGGAATTGGGGGKGEGGDNGGVPSVTDTEGFADDEDDTTDDDSAADGAKASGGSHRTSTAVARGRGAGATPQGGGKRGASSALPAFPRSAASSDEEEEGNEADEEDNDWDGEDEEESEETSEQEEHDDPHEGHEELELSLAERDQDEEEADEP